MNPNYSRYYTFVKPILKNKLFKTYTFITFSLITSVFLVIFAVQPTLKTIISLEKSIQQEQDILNKLNQKSKNLSLGRKNYDQLDQQTKLNLTSLIPDKPTLPLLIDDLSSIANAHQASISALQFQSLDLPINTKNASSTAVLNTIDFTFNMQGSYRQFLDLLDSIKKFNHLIEIGSVAINKPTEGVGLIMLINAKSYYITN